MPRFTPDKIAILNRNISRYAPAQIANFIYEGQVDFADLPTLTGVKKQAVELMVQRLKTEEAQKPNPEEQAQWLNLTVLNPAADDLDAQRALCLSLQTYINRWSAIRPAGSHVDEAQSRLSSTQALIAAITAGAELADWQALFPTPSSQPTIAQLAAFLAKYPETTHRSEVEQAMWNCVLRADDKAVAGNTFRQHFPASPHVAELTQLATELTDWNAVANSPDLLVLRDYIATHPTSVYLPNAKQRYTHLRGEIFDKLQRRDSTISAKYALQLLEASIISEAELVERGLCPRGFTKSLQDHVEMQRGLPDILTEITKCHRECATGNFSDAYFFGIPSTGKSCILMGLLGSESVNFDSVRAGGPYAMALQQYLIASSTIGSTPPDFVATLQSTIYEPSKTKAHYVNLVEIAGEDFACKIADNPNGNISFADMGNGLPQLLANDNPKIFFLIIDPTTERVCVNRLEPTHAADGSLVSDDAGNPVLSPRPRNILQSLTLKRMVDLMCQPENAEVMRKVEAIHLIVSKADTLGEGAARDERAREIVNRLYGKVLEPLKALCRQYDINRYTDYTPQLYTFSLGNFYLCGIYHYAPTDAAKLASVIRDATPAYNLNRGLFRKLGEFFNS